jgi:uncharacterized membrane protein YfcA
LGQEVTVAEVIVLIGVGVLAGIVSTVASLASVVSYPALLALGVPPLSANVTNTVALLFTGVGATLGSRPELAGQWRQVRRLGLIAALGGAAGAALLLATPAQTFEQVAPVLIGGASLVLLVQPGTERRARPADSGRRKLLVLAGVFCVASYVGYFGAAGGIMLLAILTPVIGESMARTNAVKNVLSGLANTVAAVGFALFGPVHWAFVAPLAAGFLLGGWTGPALVRRLPGRPLRIFIALCGVALAVKLAIGAYR